MTALMDLGKEFDFKVCTNKQKDLSSYSENSSKKQQPSHIFHPNERNTKPG